MEEMKCSVCGSSVNTGDSFCQNCGSPIVVPTPTEDTVTSAQPVMSEAPEAPAMPETLVAPEAPTMSEPSTAPETLVMPETPVMTDTTVQQDTASMASTPFSLSGDEQSTTSGTYGTYQAPNPGMNTTYQQDSVGMNTNYQGTYNATYTQNTMTAPVKQSKGLGIAGLILAIIGLLTSCCFGGFLFGLIGIILSIVAIAKNKGKGQGIAGLVIGVISLIISIFSIFTFDTFWTAFEEAMEEQGYDMDGSDDYDYYDDYDYDDDESDDYSYNDSTLSGTSQIMVEGTVYNFPASLEELGLSINSADSSIISDIESNGMYSGDYEFVLFDSADGYSFWGYIENTGYDTVYSVDELQVTGINVDNYSSSCTATLAEVYGGVTLNMSRTEVEALIGTEDYLDDDGLSVYESESGYECLRLEYDEYDNVCAIDVTVY